MENLTPYFFAFVAQLFWIHGWSKTDLLLTIWVTLNILRVFLPPIKYCGGSEQVVTCLESTKEIWISSLTVWVFFSSYWNFCSSRDSLTFYRNLVSKKHLHAIKHVPCLGKVTLRAVLPFIKKDSFTFYWNLFEHLHAIKHVMTRLGV